MKIANKIYDDHQQATNEDTDNCCLIRFISKLKEKKISEDKLFA